MTTHETATQIVEAAGSFKAVLDAHPECRADLAFEAALAGRPREHAAFYLGRFPDIHHGEGQCAPPPPPRTPEERLLDWLQGAAGPVAKLNPIEAIRTVGKGPGTMAASFGIRLDPAIGFTPQIRLPYAHGESS